MVEALVSIHSKSGFLALKYAPRANFALSRDLSFRVRRPLFLEVLGGIFVHSGLRKWKETRLLAAAASEA